MMQPPIEQKEITIDADGLPIPMTIRNNVEGENAIRRLLDVDNNQVRGFGDLVTGNVYRLGPAANNPLKTPVSRMSYNETTSKNDSPGVQIDKAQVGDPGFLDTVFRACCEDIQPELICIPESPFKTPNLKGGLANKEVGHTRNMIDGRIRKEPTYVGNNLAETLSVEGAMHQILMGKSGVGKTTAIFDAARKVYCVYFVATDNAVATNTNLDPAQVDRSFCSMVESVRFITASNRDDKQKEIAVDHCILATVLARVMLMITFQNLPGATPENWLHYQLTQSCHYATNHIFARLHNRDPEKVQKIEEKLVDVMRVRHKHSWFVAYDEAHYGYNILKGEIKSWKSSKKNNKSIEENDDEPRGISCPFLRIAASMEVPVVVAGTALTLGSAKSIIGDFGKTKTTRTIRFFPGNSFDEVLTELRKLLNLDGVDLDQLPLWKLAGRGRLLGGLLGLLDAKARDFDGEAGDKTYHLTCAIETHYDRMLAAAKGKVLEHLPGTHDILTKTTQINLTLLRLALASLWGGVLGFDTSAIDVDLLDIGICSVQKLPFPERTVYMLDEELGRQAIVEAAKTFNYANTTLGLALSLSKESKGHLIEPVIVTELSCWCERNKDESGNFPSVRTFLEHLFDDLPNLPDWIKNASFCVKRAAKACNEGGVQNDIEFIADAIDRGTNRRNVLLSPSTVKRPDFEGVMDSASGTWFLAVSSKLYNSTYDDRSGSDLRSTDPRNGFYLNKDGEENKNCHTLCQKWIELVNKNTATFGRCLRLHFCLPDVELQTGKTDYIRMEEGGSIVAYITKKNVRKIFSDKATRILEELDVLDMEHPQPKRPRNSSRRSTF